MGDYYDCKLFKKTKAGKTYAITIGSARMRDDGSFSVWLDALPPNGEFAIFKRDEMWKAKTPERTSQPGDDELRDEIPF